MITAQKLEQKILLNIDTIKAKIYLPDNLDIKEDIDRLRILNDQYKSMTGNYFNIERLKYDKR